MMHLPDYLGKVEINKYQAPTVNKPDRIPFDLMDPLMFERFCCDLIDYMMAHKLRRSIFNVLPIGTTGQKQYGADIFVENNEDVIPTYSLYEVKRVKNYGVSDYKKTVTRFLENLNNWGVSIDKFTLLVAEDISAETIAIWKKEAGKLSEIEVEYEIISIKKLNDWVRDFPELIYKYFHQAWVEAFWGESAVWHIKKYGIFRFKESASWVGYENIENEVYDSFLSYKNDHVRIQGFLPEKSKNNLSCLVEFRNGKFSHVMTTLSEKQLLERYFIGCEIPMEEFEHPYFIKNITDVCDTFFCDIGNSRILISKEEALAFQEAMQFFKNEYVSRISQIENTWRSSNFSTYAYKGSDIPLMSVKRGLWRAMLAFARENDAFETEGEWSLFDSGSSWLKIYTRSSSNKMEGGYHVFIKPQAIARFHTNYTSSDNDVILAWSPPGDLLVNDFEGKIGPRYYWDAKTTHDWLVNELIPRVLEWDRKPKNKKRQISFRKLLSKFLYSLSEPDKNDFDRNVYKPEYYLESYYEEDFSKKLDSAVSIKDMLGFLDELQRFFAGTKRLYIREKNYKALYFNLADLMSKTEVNEHGFAYVSSNLNYLDVSDYKTLISSLRAYALSEKSGCSNAFKLDCLLRCYLSCLRDEKCHLNEVEIKAILSELRPVFELMNERYILERQLQKL